MVFAFQTKFKQWIWYHNGEIQSICDSQEYSIGILVQTMLIANLVDCFGYIRKSLICICAMFVIFGDFRINRIWIWIYVFVLIKPPRIDHNAKFNIVFALFNYPGILHVYIYISSSYDYVLVLIYDWVYTIYKFAQ